MIGRWLTVELVADDELMNWWTVELVADDELMNWWIDELKKTCSRWWIDELMNWRKLVADDELGFLASMLGPFVVFPKYETTL